ncbi:MAG: hypothetical protein NWE78_03265, partial [Candidatus Bathyarchaeota archaeon]|nr:hypothetical protein [Candidatus Bathyarchaeota archaeon]
MSFDIGREGLNKAVEAGASYADIRIGEILDENLTVKNGLPEDVNLSTTKGFGIRVMIKGCWGFAASVDLTRKEIMEVARRAVSIARASAKTKRKATLLKEAPDKKDSYSTPMKNNPFRIPLEEKMEVLIDAERTVAKQSNLIKVSYAFFRSMQEKKLFMNTEGAEIKQQINWGGGGILAVAIKNGEVQ